MTSPPEPAALTPGALAVRLSVTDRTVRRLAEAYSEVYGELPRDQRQHRRFPLEAVLRLEQAAEMMRAAPGSSTVEILTALRDGLTPTRQRHQPAVLATPDVLGPVMEELRVLRAELDELHALVVTLQPSQPSEPPLEPTDQHQLSTAGVAAEPMPGPPEVLVSPVNEPELRANQAGLLERIRAGGRLVHRGQQVMELNANGGKRRAVHPHTVQSLVTVKGLLVRNGDDLKLTPAAVKLLGAKTQHEKSGHRTAEPPA